MANPALSLPAGSRGFISALGVAQICSWGSLYYSFPQIAQAVGAEFGWTKPELYGAVPLGLLLSSFATFPVGVAIDRGYGRYVMAGASLLAGLLLVAWSQIDTLFGFYGIFAVIGCLQAATLYEPAFAVIVRRFGSGQARSGITALTLWGGFASTVFIPIIELLISQLGWRGALMVLGGVNVLICAAIYLSVIRPERDAVDHVEAKPNLIDAFRNPAVGRALRLPVFWALLICYFCYALLFSSFTFHMYPLFIEKGLSAVDVVTVIACIGPSQVGGRVFITFVARNASIPAIGCAVVGVMALVFVAAAVAPPSFVFMAAIGIGYGATNGIVTIVRGMSIPSLVSKTDYGSINGVLIGPYMLAIAVGPMAAAWLHEAGGGYDTVQIAMIVLSSIVALAFWTAVALRPAEFRS
ncbi:MAG: MFS transporter [Alphaproteobacteria bacterium]